MKSSLKLNLSIVLIAIFVGLGLGELSLKLLGYHRYQTWLEITERGYFKNRAHFVATEESFTDSLFQYTFDSFGNRISPEQTLKKNANQIAIFGDSFAFGLYLPDSQTLAYKLNKQTNSETQFINAGVGGSGTADHVLLIQSYFKTQKATQILLLINYDDVDRCLDKNLFVLDNDTFKESKRWDKTSFYDAVFKTKPYSFLEKHSYIFVLVSKLCWEKFFFVDDFTKSESERKYLWPKNESFNVESDYSLRLWVALIKEIKTICEENQVQLNVATTGYVPNKEANPHSYRVYSELPEIMKNLAINFADLHPRFESEIGFNWSLVRIKGDNHPNNLGTDFISDELITHFWKENIAQ